LIGIVVALAIFLLTFSFKLLCNSFSEFHFTLVIGSLIISVLLFVFLFKFFFNSSENDNTDLILLDPLEEPELFKILYDLCAQCNLKLPANVFLASDTNAYVKFKSNFWSLFFPVKRDLVIGYGLLNSVSTEEFKAILAHELGHFQQKGLHINSYIAYAHKVIYDMVYNSSEFNFFAEMIAETKWIIRFFVAIALLLSSGIKICLKSVFLICFKSNLSLSREMEKIADAFAIKYTNKEHFSNALLHLDFGMQAFQLVEQCYSDYLSNEVLTKDIYSKHRLVMEKMATYYFFESKNGLTVLPPLKYFNCLYTQQSSICDFSSHPSTYWRIKSLESYTPNIISSYTRATSILHKNESYIEVLSMTLFPDRRVTYNTTYQSDDEFMNKINDYYQSPYNTLFNNYFDQADVHKFEVHSPLDDFKTDIASLFSEEKVLRNIELQLKKHSLNFISTIHPNNKYLIDFQGEEISASQLPEKIDKLKEDIDKLQNEVDENNRKIYTYFRQKAIQQNCLADFEILLDQHIQTREWIDMLSIKVASISINTKFISEELNIIKTILAFQQMRDSESEFKLAIEYLLEDEDISRSLSEKDANKLIYFSQNNFVYYDFYNKYYQEEIVLLKECIQIVIEIVHKIEQNNKKQILKFYEQLELN
jgi:Zn-dependent protease with chaperone function